MQYLNDEGFVIKRVNFGEADKYLTLFTKNNGKVEIVAKGVRKITSKRASHIELLNLIRFQAVKTSKNFVLTEVQLQNSFEHARQNLSSITTAFLICELIDKLCPVNQRHEDIFELVRHAIFQIQEDSQKQVMYEFQVELLTKLGFWSNHREFESEEDLQQFIENITERKIKTRIYS